MRDVTNAGYKKPKLSRRGKQGKEKKEGKNQKAQVLIKWTPNKRNQALGAAWLHPLFLQQPFCDLPECSPNSHSFSNTGAIHSNGQKLLPSSKTVLLYFRWVKWVYFFFFFWRLRSSKLGWKSVLPNPRGTNAHFSRDFAFGDKNLMILATVWQKSAWVTKTQSCFSKGYTWNRERDTFIFY